MECIIRLSRNAVKYKAKWQRNRSVLSAVSVAEPVRSGVRFVYPGLCSERIVE